ncbi:hypothetical protein B296_00017623 [Ensete ventricosum]|uniref:Uncharacterized protein n=1 Tax=Ensete ventricosum TaxID=4639 RepID=A0A426ZUF2_ENSVE|nr:hypothetical protein B296_00017623 [Ensete ventricosum]
MYYTWIDEATRRRKPHRRSSIPPALGVAVGRPNARTDRPLFKPTRRAGECSKEAQRSRGGEVTASYSNEAE